MNKKMVIGAILILVAIFISVGMFLTGVDITSLLYPIPTIVGLVGAVIIYMEMKKDIDS